MNKSVIIEFSKHNESYPNWLIYPYWCMYVCCTVKLRNS